MSELQINVMLDVLVFLLTMSKLYFGHWTDFGAMTRLGLFLGSAWLLADDFDVLNLIPGDYSHYSIMRTGTFKLCILIGLLLDLLRLHLGKVNTKKYASLIQFVKTDKEKVDK